MINEKEKKEDKIKNFFIFFMMLVLGAFPIIAWVLYSMFVEPKQSEEDRLTEQEIIKHYREWKKTKKSNL